ncbi:unnamed protein product [Adineta steineri]|uniref:Uncharacterized protein n=1 Tax=Adineta steineri TaxID=433720 RepID=A0A819L7F4_9BILA|nr:unnamed protein product [Adineta steineri]CAF3956717.1 unnamed protein product [Adineta steineri]
MIIIGIVLNVLFCSTTNSRRFSRIKKQIKIVSTNYSNQSIDWNINKIKNFSKLNQKDSFNFLDYNFEILIEILHNDDLPKYESIQFNQNDVDYHSTSNEEEQEQISPPSYSSLCT